MGYHRFLPSRKSFVYSSANEGKRKIIRVIITDPQKANWISRLAVLIISFYIALLYKGSFYYTCYNAKTLAWDRAVG